MTILDRISIVLAIPAIIGLLWISAKLITRVLING